jgi:CHAD domain-containing protein
LLPELLAKRLRKFAAVLPKVLSEGEADAIHDLRVWSRRLQQALVTLLRKPRSSEAQEIVRALRRARRAVGGWRDCDVLLDLLARRIRRMRNSDERRAWETVREALNERRAREMHRARRKLANHKLFTLAHDVARLMQSPAPELGTTNGAIGDDPAARLSIAIGSVWRRWQDSLSRARATADPADLHAFRIQTKRLRYRIELARELGAAESDAPLKSLKSLQDRLGRLHDRGEFARLAAEAIARPELLIREPRAASLLLRRLAREQEAERAESGIVIAEAEAGAAATEQWVERYRGLSERESPPADDARPDRNQQ